MDGSVVADQQSNRGTIKLKISTVDSRHGIESSGCIRHRSIAPFLVADDTDREPIRMKNNEKKVGRRGIVRDF